MAKTPVLVLGLNEFEMQNNLKDAAFTPTLVIVPPGKFIMGRPENEDDDAWPLREVEFDRPFAIGRYAVSFQEWDHYATANNGFIPSDNGWGRSDRPVVNISWNDAKAYIDWLSSQSGYQYRLPSEAEWEYAAKAGTRTPYWWGEEMQPEYAHYNPKGAPINQSRNTRKKTAPIGAYGANPWGLHQVNGNVWEWCEDNWAPNYRAAPTDGSAYLSSNNNGRRIIRGGGWDAYPEHLRSDYRGAAPQFMRTPSIGLRAVRELTSLEISTLSSK